ncbi:outer membrane lipid asymmetry maintenance protein MlaD [Nordella sp. HKS 07]|uniref:outer membrane lipid asymmetry maintenance protein MlaD n=1 Tax=Nordella sp. HKS 07 TaxID=2712222 RepID=UPI0013E17801|nr:outer membrane lipid asymmetry maintenance protein MlaD [Nordella sp. HKS 07]QIG50737.1 outer membrane lipid asymmetry maintenance protein MlaD [Nordella sp. HKS 07]
MKNTTVETAIGALVILIAAGFFLFAYSTSGAGTASGGYTLKAEFDNVAGVNTGTDVRLAGIKVGTVVSQTLNPDNYQAVVTMTIDPKLKLTDDTTAKITSEGLLGSNFVALDPGGSETLLADGGEIVNTQGAVDIWSLISRAMFEGKGSGGDKPAENTAPQTPAPETQPQ